MNRAEGRFLALWSRCGGLRGEAVYAELLQHYAEPARCYHTLSHVRYCIRCLDWARAAIPDPDSVELALWCHDVIYIPGAGDNERRSAEWLQRCAEGRIAAAERIAGMIMATTHALAPADLDGHFVADIDLAKLGGDDADFRRDAANLRAERRDLDDVAYDCAERAFLIALLARPRIYHTDFFHYHCEARARANLMSRLARPALR
jgi:predicted metal-dependent HD superfamily phosphohydrolase